MHPRSLARPALAALVALALLAAACGGLGPDELPEEIGSDERGELRETIAAFIDGVNRYNPEVASEVMLIPALFSATSAHAQNPPATYYGVASSGDSISAVIGGTTCDTVTADANGEWVIEIPESGCDGAAVSGAAVSFTLNGATADQSETWEAGGTPADRVNGISLTATGGGTPAPPDTGNAGFAVGGGAAAPWLALSLGLFALATVAGVRMATTKVR